MSALDDVKAKGLPYHDDESGLIRLSILELDARADDLNDRLDAQWMGVGKIERKVDELDARVKELEDRLTNHFHPEPWTPKPDVLGDPEIKVAMDKWKAEQLVYDFGKYCSAGTWNPASMMEHAKKLIKALTGKEE